MKFANKIELRNILLDVIITLLAFQLIDVSWLVEKTLSVAIYFIIIIQSFALFLILSEDSVDDVLKFEENSNFFEKIKTHISIWLRGFAMFSWVIGPLWIMIPLDYLQGITGQDYYWAHKISMFVGIISGLILLVRFFANSSSNSESAYIEGWYQKPFKEKAWAEIIILPAYHFLFYQNIGTTRFRYWLAYFVTFGYLIYTETLFEVLIANSSISHLGILLGVLGSYFPIRMLLLLKPPFSIFEVVSAFTAFSIFIYMLFA